MAKPMAPMRWSDAANMADMTAKSMLIVASVLDLFMVFMVF
ncbi:hypothetical protein DSM100688_0403 [Bifidobacterium ramosum]|uniref:Uncharacterized protein n=1 Tax=Bifidobacterium ramosum TaxID=1798158 RepID=A0A6L4X439_9BIFI|nr:hypothetical protein DSM100688_0403 [Bifidobacterium ramosum]